MNGQPQEIDIAEAVDRIARHSLFSKDELQDGRPPPGAVEAPGIFRKFYFHPERLASNKAEIAALIARALRAREDEAALNAVRDEVVNLTAQFPIHAH